MTFGDFTGFGLYCILNPPFIQEKNTIKIMISSSIFRNYDIRGEYGVDLTDEAAYQIAKAFIRFSGATKVVVGYDCRLSSLSLKTAVARGLTESGAAVTDIGLTSTDGLYFATRHYGSEGGIMITASHMPKQFNGLKFVRLNKQGMLTPIGRGVGMEELEEIAQKQDFVKPKKIGEVAERNIWPDFVKFSRSFVEVKNIKPLKVVMDAGNGMGGPVAEQVFAGLGLDIIPLFFDPDGNFPNHQASPIEEANRVDWVAKAKEVKADLGVAWDADCDRVYFLDEKANFINGDFITALLAINFLEKNPGASIVYDLRASLVVKDWVEKMGGKPQVERVGHTYIKKRMQEADAIFGGEISGHYYFASNAYMENGFVPALMIMEMMGKRGKKLSELIKELGEYHISGEINFKVADVPKVLKNLEEKYSNAKEIYKIDGVSLEFGDWRFNVRPSANDPVIRLNLEAKTKELMEKKLAEVKKLIK